VQIEIVGNDNQKYMLQKDDPGWSLWKWRGGGLIRSGVNKGKPSECKWRSMGLYPNDIEYALKLVLSDHTGDVTALMDFRTAMKYLKEYTASVTCKVKEIEELVE
jgi:hypothetical protein